MPASAVAAHHIGDRVVRGWERRRPRPIARFSRELGSWRAIDSRASRPLSSSRNPSASRNSGGGRGVQFGERRAFGQIRPISDRFIHHSSKSDSPAMYAMRHAPSACRRHIAMKWKVTV